MLDVILSLIEPIWDLVADNLGELVSSAGETIAENLPEIATAVGAVVIATATVTVVLKWSKLKEIVEKALRDLQLQGKVKDLNRAFGKVMNDPSYQVDIGYFTEEGEQIGKQTIETPNGVEDRIKKDSCIWCVN